jgi:hypothetical protein
VTAALAGLRVLDLTTSIAGAGYSAKAIEAMIHDGSILAEGETA